jgi:hypothetical protein
MTSKVIFTGCSYVSGFGLQDERLDQNLWVNILHQGKFSEFELVNLGVSGNTNTGIFQDSLKAILDPDCKHLVVSWTELFRHVLTPGVETYHTELFWSYNGKITSDININPNVVYNIKYLEDLRDRFFDLHHMHYEIVKILSYTGIIQNLCNRLGIIVYFVNSIVHEWDQDFFIHSNARYSSDTTPFTQKLLNMSTRDDAEFLVLYNKIHKDYSETGGLPPECNWLNLHHCYRKKFYVDLALDKLHPGIESNRQFAQYLINQLN